MNFDAVSLRIVESNPLHKLSTRTEVQDGGERNTSASVTAVLAKFAQGKGDSCQTVPMISSVPSIISLLDHTATVYAPRR